MDFLDFDESESPEDSQSEAVLEAEAGEEAEETEEEGNDEDEEDDDEDEEDDDDPPVASSSGQGPIIEIAGMPSW